jgi:hypothetical protein
MSDGPTSPEQPSPQGSSIDYMRHLGQVGPHMEGAPDSVKAVTNPVDLSPDAGDFKMNPEILAQIMSGMFGEGIVEKITKAPTEQERKYWTYFIMDRIVNYNDEWPAKSLRESIALRAAGGSDALNELSGGSKKTQEQVEKQKGIEQSLTIIQDVDKLFDQWFAFYKKLAPSGKIFQLVYGELPEYMPPEFFARVYGEMPGFIEGDREWKSVSEQVDIGIRAFTYLALQSDPRWKTDLDWFRNGKGFKKLFVNETTENEWLYKLKLKTLPNEYNKAAYLYGKSYESLTAEDKAVLDSIPAFNKFADSSNGGSVKATLEAVQDLMSEGKFKNHSSMKMQSQIAVNFAEKTFRFFGLAAMYGTRATKTDGDRAIQVNAEDYPWSDAMTDLTRPRDNTVYNRQNSYYEGPFAWANFAPEHIMVDFLRTVPVRDRNFPESKSKTRSAMELFVEGKTLGEIFKDEDHTADWGYRAYLIRALFSLREDTGAYLAMNGELTKGKNRENGLDPVYWEGVEKSIHIVCRDWIITEGKYEKWFSDHLTEIDTLMDKMQTGGNKLPNDQLRIEAEDALLKKYVKKEKNKWKAIAFLSAVQATISTERQAIIETAASVGYLDKKILDTSKSINFAKSETEEEKALLNNQIGAFIRMAVNSTD